ncbi:MAG: hypothetical protein RLZZ561_703 [Pseudomonadota bacterium]|jgi:hypothetical protein
MNRTALSPTDRWQRFTPRSRKPADPFRHVNSSPAVSRVVMMYVRFLLCLRNIDDLVTAVMLVATFRFLSASVGGDFFWLMRSKT